MEQKQYLTLKREIYDLTKQHNKLTALCALLYSNIKRSKSDINELKKEIFLLKGGDINEYEKQQQMSNQQMPNQQMPNQQMMGQQMMGQQMMNQQMRQPMNQQMMRQPMNQQMMGQQMMGQQMMGQPMMKQQNDMKADQILKQLSEQNM